MKVLVADDDHLTRLLLTAAVSGLGHECLVAEDGQRAWELYRESRPDVLITDWLMPRVDGVELCRLVRSDPGVTYTYVIVLTSRAARDDLLVGMEAGADDYIVKPLDPLELKARLIAAERVAGLGAGPPRTDGERAGEASRRSTVSLGPGLSDETAQRVRVLRNAVSELTASGDDQLLGVAGTHPDDFALAFYEGFALLSPLRGEGMGFPRQALYALHRIDELLQSMSRTGDAGLWNVEAMRSHFKWQEVRDLARDALASLPSPVPNEAAAEDFAR